MENSRQKNKFYFPSTPIQDVEFEFGSITTPGSPNSPADRLFSNGRLLPHDFPCPPAKKMSSLSRSTSRTSSFSSKGSLESSRSNSISSMNSSCSSSASRDGLDTRMLMRCQAKSTGTKTTAGTSMPFYRNSKPVLNAQFGPQRWQFITPAPALRRKGSVRTGAETAVQEVPKDKIGVEGKKNGGVGFFRRFFCWFVSACSECHAIKPSKRVSLQANNI